MGLLCANSSGSINTRECQQCKVGAGNAQLPMGWSVGGAEEGEEASRERRGGWTELSRRMGTGDDLAGRDDVCWRPVSAGGGAVDMAAQTLPAVPGLAVRNLCANSSSANVKNNIFKRDRVAC